MHWTAKMRELGREKIGQSVPRGARLPCIVACVLMLSVGCSSSETATTTDSRLCHDDCAPYCDLALDEAIAPNGPLCRAIPSTATTRHLTVSTCAGRTVVVPSDPQGVDTRPAYLFDADSHRFVERATFNNSGWLQCGSYVAATCDGQSAAPRTVDCAP